MTDNLQVLSADGLYKYVDDTTTHEVFRKNFGSQAKKPLLNFIQRNAKS